MKKENIPEIENLLDIMERESKILEDAFERKDLNKMSESKKNISRIQNKINNIVR